MISALMEKCQELGIYVVYFHFISQSLQFSSSTLFHEALSLLKCFLDIFPGEKYVT